MTTQHADTIAAVATAPGRGAVGIVRLSGPGAFGIAERIAGEIPPPRQATLRHFRDEAGAPIDEGLLIVFPAPNSYTGEDVVELQGHGGPVVLDLILHAACTAGARPARPGEFSERAFLNDRLDLAQAEAIADLISASTEQAARAAQRSLDGEFSKRVHAIVEETTRLRMFVEGALDFSDEEVNWLADDELRTRLSELVAHLGALLHQAAQGRRLREGLVVALAGRPNVGKSTVLNRLAGAEAAIVTEIAGTTRDVLRENVNLDGLPLTVVDTAGLRESRNRVEQEGIRRAWQALENAELILFLVDDREGVTPTDVKLMKRLPVGAEVVIVRNKCDLTRRKVSREEHDGRIVLRLAAGKDRGMDELRAEIRRVAGLSGSGESLFSARTRHVDALRRALACVRDAELRLTEGAAAELAAEELRIAQQALSEITGAFSSDDLLGRIFADFCIGK